MAVLFVTRAHGWISGRELLGGGEEMSLPYIPKVRESQVRLEARSNTEIYCEEPDSVTQEKARVHTHERMDEGISVDRALGYCDRGCGPESRSKWSKWLVKWPSLIESWDLPGFSPRLTTAH